jgi:hypothetical protein
VIAVGYFYNAPTPGPVFDELLAIPVAGGVVATATYAEYVHSVAPVVATGGRRLVVQSAVVEHGLIWRA